MIEYAAQAKRWKCNEPVGILDMGGVWWPDLRWSASRTQISLACLACERFSGGVVDLAGVLLVMHCIIRCFASGYRA